MDKALGDRRTVYLQAFTEYNERVSHLRDGYEKELDTWREAQETYKDQHFVYRHSVCPEAERCDIVHWNGAVDRQVQPGELLRLPEDEVHVWYSDLECPPDSLAVFFDLLSEQEKERAGRFYFERDRRRYIIGRGTLRRLLGGYLGLEPDQVEIETLEHGKPALKSAQAQPPPVQFNLAHSQNLAVYAFHRCCPLGIDVEFVQPMPDEDSFAAMFFSQRESAWLAEQSGVEKTSRFFKLWTCKEAYLKAHGAGLVKPLNQVEVWLEEDEPPRLASIDGDETEAAQWRLVMFTPADGFQGALVVEGSGWQPVFLRVAL